MLQSPDPSHLSCADASPVGVSPVAPSPSSLLTRQLQESWRTLRGLSGGSPTPAGRRLTDNLLFEVTDASVVQDGSSKYVVSPNIQVEGQLEVRQTGAESRNSNAGHVGAPVKPQSTRTLLKH